MRYTPPPPPFAAPSPMPLPPFRPYAAHFRAAPFAAPHAISRRRRFFRHFAVQRQRHAMPRYAAMPPPASPDRRPIFALLTLRAISADAVCFAMLLLALSMPRRHNAMPAAHAILRRCHTRAFRKMPQSDYAAAPPPPRWQRDAHIAAMSGRMMPHARDAARRSARHYPSPPFHLTLATRRLYARTARRRHAFTPRTARQPRRCCCQLSPRYPGSMP